jgi:iron complex transport system ATP-binding protein
VAAAKEDDVVPVLTAVALSVGRGRIAVLRDIALSVGRGERIALVGANGSGKTTLLRALAGIDRPLSGELRCHGRALPVGPARIGTLGVLFQGETPGPFSVRELVTLGLGLDGRPSAAQRAQIDATIDRVQLGPLADEAVAQLSGGEAQRAAIARALVAGPALLLLDEPTNHLDPAQRAALLALLDDLRGTVAVVLATHDLDCAAAADRVLLLGQGGIIAAGAPAEVLTPAQLGRAFGTGIVFRRLPDPAGGRLFLRVEAAP